jgi:hypothetical protein
MSNNNNNQLDELRRYSIMLSKRIFMKFGINTSDSKEEWGWFIDPELNYHMFNKNKYAKNVYTTKHVSIPETIKEYPSIRSRQSITNLNDFENNKNSDCKNKDKNNKNNTPFNYKKIATRLVTIAVFVSLSYFILIL